MDQHGLRAFIGELLFPAGCAVCGGDLLLRGFPSRGLCPDCLSAFPHDPSPRCRLCGRPLLAEEGLCMRCRSLENPPAIAIARSLYCYTGPARTLMQSYKFSHHRQAGFFIARAFKRELSALMDGAHSCRGTAAHCGEWTLVPAPSSPGKRKRSGWDQMLLVARELSRLSELPLSDCLVRDPSRSQKKLGRLDREANLHGKIHCRYPPPGQAILLDDVVTTGATLRSCARSLLEAGCTRVVCLAFCYD